MSQGERRLAAIMFTDIVGYTAMTQASESRAMAVLETHNALLRPFFPLFMGREVKAIGDSFLVEFESALDALRCAVEIQSRLHGYNQSATAEGKIRLRIGIHLGDVIHREGDVFGDAVNISSRIQPLADPEGICITRQVYDQVRNKFDLPLVSQGEKELRNVTIPVEVYSVRMPWDATMATGAAESRRVAVLPFSNMSPDPADEYFADGLTEELISTVSRIDGAEVISRTSVMQYKKSPKPIRLISSELDAGTVLEGSVRKAGNRLRVTVQMIDAPRDRHIWAESYDRNLDDIFAIQSDIAGRVADALKARMSREKPGRDGGTENLDAYTSYLRALHLYNEGTRASSAEAVSLLENSVKIDPGFAKAYAQLARVWRAEGSFEDYSLSVSKAESAALRAIELAPDLAESHAAMATVHMALDRFEEARRELERAVELNPNLSEAIYILGEVDGTFGDFEKAIPEVKKAYALDPLSLNYGCVLAHMLRIRGSFDEAMELVQRLKQTYPSSEPVYDAMAILYASREDYGKAMESVEEGLKKNPSSASLKVDRGLLYAFSGRREEAEAELNGLMAEPGTSFKVNARLVINAALGNKDEALKALDEAADLHSWMFLVDHEPMLAGIRDDPRYAAFRKKVGLQR